MGAGKQFMPYLGEGVRVACIMGTGDLIAQTAIEKKRLSDVDLVRTAKFSSIGLIVVGPVLRYWYGALERLVAKNQTPFQRGLKKMALDQTCMAPTLSMVLIGLIGMVNGDTPHMAKERIKADYFTIMKSNYMLWPTAQIINFTFVPVKNQVLFAQVIAVMWNTYLSMVLNKK